MEILASYRVDSLSVRAHPLPNLFRILHHMVENQLCQPGIPQVLLHQWKINSQPVVVVGMTISPQASPNPDSSRAQPGDVPVVAGAVTLIPVQNPPSVGSLGQQPASVLPGRLGSTIAHPAVTGGPPDTGRSNNDACSAPTSSTSEHWSHPCRAGAFACRHRGHDCISRSSFNSSGEHSEFAK